MQPKYIQILILFSLLLLFGCEKKEYPYITIAENAKITCEEMPSEYYFEGFINGEKICFHEGFNNYYTQFSRWVGYNSGATVDLDPSDNTGAAWGGFAIIPRAIESGPREGKIPYGAQYIEIYSPEFPIETSKQDILQELIENQSFTIVEEEERNNSYDFRWMIRSDDETGNYGRVYSFGGPQPNAYLRITELETEEYDDRTYYTMTLEMACDLYIGGIASMHYGRLEDGKMRLSFFLDKE